MNESAIDIHPDQLQGQLFLGLLRNQLLSVTDALVGLECRADAHGRTAFTATTAPCQVAGLRAQREEIQAMIDALFRRYPGLSHPARPPR
ncbi:MULTISPECIES: hypothetical protein [unclassified Rhodococcus (in: high G+C Gram-positive bacteria)]|uniref:hypothetical protein n=1 Tax=unclassified Rhodococcus (in: high G+C Gram-positive bacteria) TaxID=192944 RepID=UPI0011153E1E|nr:hypothetical protein [Rhodococcus sp. M8]QPG48445.1 hypothetical protein ISO16_27885 [Rhodococcus sp. M8]